MAADLSELAGYLENQKMTLEARAYCVGTYVEGGVDKACSTTSTAYEGSLPIKFAEPNYAPTAVNACPSGCCGCPLEVEENTAAGITAAQLQAVDDKVASHYWDYTIDAERSYTNSTYSYASSELFDPDWFGPVNPHHKDHVVDSGRWAYTAVLADARSFSNITNPFGLLRSPWNTNPAPYVSRYNRVIGVVHGQNHLPICAEFQQETIMGGMSIGRIFSALNSGLHGSVHIMLGGHWGFPASRKWLKPKREHRFSK